MTSQSPSEDGSADTSRTTGTSTSDSTDTDPELSRMYRGYDDDHDADTLSDFGFDLTLTEDEGVLVPPESVDHIDLDLERADDFPIDHVVVQPIGVGPTLPEHSMFADVEGTESVFVYLHPVRDYDITGHYVQSESKHTLAHFERSSLERFCEQHTIVEATDGGLYHWQDPENDPNDHCSTDE